MREEEGIMAAKYPYSKGGNPLTSFVNMGQSKAERKYKYRILRALGRSSIEAQRYRDWRYTSLARIVKIHMVRYGDD